MKNVTITLDEETARWARIQAARQNTSVSRMLGQVLQEMRAMDEQRDTAAARFLGRPTRVLRDTDAPIPTANRCMTARYFVDTNIPKPF